MRVANLPDGAMVAIGDEAFMIAKGRTLRWAFEGYRDVPTDLADAQLLTPPSTLRAMMAGYATMLHESAITPPP